MGWGGAADNQTEPVLVSGDQPGLPGPVFNVDDWHVGLSASLSAQAQGRGRRDMALVQVQVPSCGGGELGVIGGLKRSFKRIREVVPGLKPGLGGTGRRAQLRLHLLHPQRGC
jgi:hypothetical protein